MDLGLRDTEKAVEDPQGQGRDWETQLPGSDCPGQLQLGGRLDTFSLLSRRLQPCLCLDIRHPASRVCENRLHPWKPYSSRYFAAAAPGPGDTKPGRIPCVLTPGLGVSPKVANEWLRPRLCVRARVQACAHMCEMGKL